MLSAIRNSPIAKRLFGEPEAPATTASTLTEVVSFGPAAIAAGSAAEDAAPNDDDLPKTPPTDLAAAANSAQGQFSCVREVQTSRAHLHELTLLSSSMHPLNILDYA